jgi:thioredoxin reductase (NADPH)
VTHESNETTAVQPSSRFRPELAFPLLTEEMLSRVRGYGSEEKVPARTRLFARGDREIDMFVVLDRIAHAGNASINASRVAR